MVDSSEKLRILQMIQEGKITPEQGVQLLDALKTSGRHEDDSAGSVAAPMGARWVRIRITDVKTEKVQVNIRLPINVVMTGMKMGANISMGIEGVNKQTLMEYIRSGEVGKVIDIMDDKDGEHLEVILE